MFHLRNIHDTALFNMSLWSDRKLAGIRKDCITLPSSGSVPSAFCEMPIHTILSTAHQCNISHKELGTLPEDGNVMPKHVGNTIHN
jgi:hypothetical protein